MPLAIAVRAKVRLPSNLWPLRMFIQRLFEFEPALVTILWDMVMGDARKALVREYMKSPARLSIHRVMRRWNCREKSNTPHALYAKWREERALLNMPFPNWTPHRQLPYEADLRGLERIDPPWAQAPEELRRKFKIQAALDRNQRLF